MSDDENNHEPTDTRMRFDELALSQPILKAVQKAGYENPSPIQERAIPPLLEGSDFIGVALYALTRLYLSIADPALTGRALTEIIFSSHTGFRTSGGTEQQT